MDIRPYRRNYGLCQACQVLPATYRGLCVRCWHEDVTAPLQPVRTPRVLAHPVAYQIHLKPRGSYAALFLGRVIAPVGV